MTSSSAMGVYFSANDKVYDWVIAFLNSYRTYNPDLRLILIPFNDECDRIHKLQDYYNFEIYTDPSFGRLEAIGQAFELGHTPTGPYWFRRYAAFWGPCERFMYLDARQVILADLKPIIQALDDHKFDFIHFDCAINQVYEPGDLRRDLLRTGNARGFNSGRWASKKGLFNLQEFESFATDALKVRNQLNPRNTDQAFINYCCDKKPVIYGHAAELLDNICQNGWARQSGHLYKHNNNYYLWDYGGLDHKKQFILVHWAGFRLNILTPNIWLLQRFLHDHKENNFSFISIKFIFVLIKSMPRMYIASLKQNRIVNMLYHCIN